MAYVEDVDLLPEESRTGTGAQISTTNFGGSVWVIVQVRVLEISGFVRIYLDDSIDGVNWFRVGNTSASSVGNVALRISSPFSDNLRVTWETGKSVASNTGVAKFAVSLAAF